jgi:hypothetical protein
MSVKDSVVAEDSPGRRKWVVRKSARGHEYRVWQREQRMPQIPQHYLDCSIYLYPSKKSAEAGQNFGGSGCLVRVETDPIYDPDSYVQGFPTRVSVVFPPHIYAVTNKHVARKGYPVVRLNTIDDTWDVFELEHHQWIPHPDGDDLAVAPIDLPKDKHNYYPIDVSTFVSRDLFDRGFPFASSIGAGDDTFMVGRFITHAGKQRNTPSLRFGSIAMLPFEEIKLGDHMQEAFLVETRSISGYSGSPVFVYRPKKETTTIPPSPHSPYYGDTYSTSITDLVGHPILLGIDCGHIDRYEDVVDEKDKAHPAGWRVKSNTGMAAVIPAWRLSDLLNTEELVMQREQKDRQWKEQQEAEEKRNGVTLDVEKPEDFTAEDYQDALHRASRKISSPDEEKNET